MLSCSVAFSSFVTPWTAAPQAPLSVGFPRQEYWSGLPFSTLGDPPDPGIELASPASLALAGRFFTTEPQREPIIAHSIPNLGRRMDIPVQRTQGTQATQAKDYSKTYYNQDVKRKCLEKVIHHIQESPHRLISRFFWRNELILCIRWPKYWSFSFSISSSNEYSAWISFRIDWFDLLAVQGTLKSLHHILWCKCQILI